MDINKSPLILEGFCKCCNGITKDILRFFLFKCKVLARGGDEGSRTPRNWIGNSVAATCHPHLRPADNTLND